MITINGKILENRFTTAQWAATTTILPDRVLGWEIDIEGNPVGIKMGDGIRLWGALPYWTGSIVVTDIELPAGTPLPLTLINGTDFTTNSLSPIVNIVRALDDTTDTNDGVTPAIVQYVFEDDTKQVLQYIIILDNGVGEFEWNVRVRVV